MNHRTGRLTLFLFLGDVALTCLSLYLASVLRAALPFGKNMSPGAEVLPLPVYLLAIFCWSGSLFVSGAYDFKRPQRLLTRITQLSSAAATATILLAGLLYMTYRQVSRLQFIYIFLLNLALLLMFRSIVTLTLWFRKGAPFIRPQRVVLIGAGHLGREVAKAVDENTALGYRLVGYLDDSKAMQGKHFVGYPVLGRIDDLLEVIEEHEVSEVWSTLPPRAYDRLHELVSRLERLPVRIKVIPDYFSLALVQAHVEMLDGFPLIGLREPLIRGLPRVIKRVFDVLASVLLIILCAPIMAAIAIAIRLDSPGPIIFRQQRVGENGKLFHMLKFRTMFADAEQRLWHQIAASGDEPIRHKRRDDPRVTKVGRFLRRSSMDELPQLFNVLRGDMSLVGPRPELPWLVERYKPWQRKRFAVPQGITGWWQINGRSDKPMHLNTDEDLYYIYNYSLWLDIKILLLTPLAVIRGKGAF